MNYNDLAYVYSELSFLQVPVITWPDLPQEVIQDPLIHENAIFLRKSRFYIRLHQDMKKKSIIQYSMAVKNRLEIL